MKERVYALELPELGILRGRDCIYIDDVTQNCCEKVIFHGDINGNLASLVGRETFIPFTLTFHSMAAYFVCDFDTYFNLPNRPASSQTVPSSVCVVENSRWIAELPFGPEIDSAQYSHYLMFTYDYVYSILAKSCTIEHDWNADDAPDKAKGGEHE